jgi:hypothetical protein
LAPNLNLFPASRVSGYSISGSRSLIVFTNPVVNFGVAVDVAVADVFALSVAIA